MLRDEMGLRPAFATDLREIYHDMRQPVASVFALAAAALAEPGIPGTARARMEDIIKQAEWLADLIWYALHTAAPDGRAGCATDLRSVAREVVDAERLTWPGEARTVTPAEPVLVAVQPVTLRRMIANLVSNAIRAAGPSGRVLVEVGCEQGAAFLCVEDTGPGFGKIEKGLGLGLAAVRRDAGQYGGKLECGNGARGGARVSLLLPRVPAEQIIPPAAAGLQSVLQT
jgi:signal transduction histidine kinase